MKPTISDIYSARDVLRDILIATPTLDDKRISQMLNAKVFLKAESLQRSGAFKIRGAYNKICRLSEDEKRRGVIAASAGNHAQGVALAARLHNVKAVIVLPEYAPLTKVTATKNFGAEVHLHGANYDAAFAYSRELQEKFGYTYVHPFDDETVIAGQGTIGLEILEDLPSVETLIVPIGGGGLMSGIAIAAKTIKPHIRLIGVQAAGSASMCEAVAKGEIIALQSVSTIADGIAVKRPGDKTFEIIRELVDEFVTVTDEEIAFAIAHCIQSNRLVVEGAGAAGVAALLANKINVREGENVCAVLCGGNIDANLLARVLEQVMVRQSRYVMLKMTLADRPGELAPLLEQVAKSGANVIEIFHRRAIWLAPLGKVGLEMILEVRDEDHARTVEDHLRSVGYETRRETTGDWE